MKSGSIVEYIDRQRIICAVVLEEKKPRLRLLNENNREVSLSPARLLHAEGNGLDVSSGRDRLVQALKERAELRRCLQKQVSVRELWEVLNGEQKWITLETMTALCFPDTPSADHSSAVLRAFFENRLYFKFNQDGFFPYSQEQVERMQSQAREAERVNRLTEAGAAWLRQAFGDRRLPMNETAAEVVEIVKSLYLLDKESPHYALGRSILSRAGIDDTDAVHDILVGWGIFEENENLDLLRLQIPTTFPEAVLAQAEKIVSSSPEILSPERRDLTALTLLTIDGQSTLDFDDALSIEKEGDLLRLGVHIADVGHFVCREDPVDREALRRGSSIYMPDGKIPMLPSILAEGLCSLKAGQEKPAISVVARMTPDAEVLDYEIFPSRILVQSQLTYYDVNLMAGQNEAILLLTELARQFRRQRMSNGALQITLPEIHVWPDRDGTVHLSTINRDSPGRMLVSEMMILANWLMARFLREKGIPAIFRSQPPPRERLYENEEGTLYQNWMQRKTLSRFILGTDPEFHSGLGLDAYVTATSPIRKYYDLATQRQIRAAIGLESPLSEEGIAHLLQILEEPMSRVGRVQSRRQRFWVLKYLESRSGEKAEAIVLHRKRSGYLILLPDYLIECDLPMSQGLLLNPEDIVQVTIRRVSARKDLISVSLG